MGSTTIAEATISGATDINTAIEVVIPNWSSGATYHPQVFLNGMVADPADYRTTSYGVKVRVGTTISNVEIHCTPLEAWVQTNWVGSEGQTIWADETRFDSASGIDNSNEGQLSLNTSSGGTVLFSDDFTRQPTPEPVPFTWIVPTTPNNYPNYGTYNTKSGTLNSGTSAPNYYGFAYTSTVLITDHSVEADIQFLPGAFGGGIFGRLDPNTGQRYAAWIYPEGSVGLPSGYGPAVIKLIKFYNWGSWSGPLGMQTVSIPAVGPGWHHLEMVFTGNRIQVFYDGSPTPIIDVIDNNAGGYPPYASGYVGVDMYANGSTYGPSYNNFIVRDSVGAVVYSDDFGPDVPNPLSPWINALGIWTVTDGVLQGTSQPSKYAYVYTYTEPLWTDYTVEGRIQFPAGAFGGGIGGRVDPASGAHYGAWVYPDGSSGGSNVLKLVKFRDWTNWNGSPMQKVNLPSVGTGWHTLKMAFDGNRVRVYYDDNLMIDLTDENYDSRAPYLNGGVSVDTWTPSNYNGSYAIMVDDIIVHTPDL
jgi:hypothetical protein